MRFEYSASKGSCSLTQPPFLVTGQGRLQFGEAGVIRSVVCAEQEQHDLGLPKPMRNLSLGDLPSL